MKTKPIKKIDRSLRKNPDGSIDWLSEPYDEMFFRMHAEAPNREWCIVQVAKRRQMEGQLSPGQKERLEVAKKELRDWNERNKDVAHFVLGSRAAESLLQEVLG